MNCRRKIPVLTNAAKKIYVSFHIFCVYLFFNSQNKAINPKKQEDKGRNVAVYVQLSTFFIRPAESFPNYGHVFKGYGQSFLRTMPVAFIGCSALYVLL